MATTHEPFCCWEIHDPALSKRWTVNVWVIVETTQGATVPFPLGHIRRNHHGTQATADHSCLIWVLYDVVTQSLAKVWASGLAFKDVSETSLWNGLGSGHLS